jgi:hypothetical protein
VVSMLLAAGANFEAPPNVSLLTGSVKFLNHHLSYRLKERHSTLLVKKVMKKLFLFS